jgi:DNA-binding transcriptional LysR family regulator
MAGELPATRAENPTCIDLKDCEAMPFVTVGDQQEMRRLFESACTAARFRPQIATEVVGLSTAWAMCRAGVGATLLPLQFVLCNGGDAGVALYTLRQKIQSRQPVIVTRRGQYRSPYAQYAIEQLIEKKS